MAVQQNAESIPRIPNARRVAGTMGCVIMLAFVPICGCQAVWSQGRRRYVQGNSTPAGPSKVIGGVKEAELTRVELTPQAEVRLGLTLVDVERKPVARAVSYGGEVMIPPGRLISVASPFLGTLKAPPGLPVPQPGVDVNPGPASLRRQADPLA